MATKTLDKKIEKAERGEAKTPDKATKAEALLKAAPKSAMPAKVKPMKATLVDEPFNDAGWVYEIKWDGYRAIAKVNDNGVELISRNNLVFDQFYPINELLKKWGHNAVLDGELLVLNDKGISNFSGIQNWRSEADGELVYYVFDVLWYEGKNLMSLPLSDRQTILTHILPKNDDRIRQSMVFEARGVDFFDAAERMGLEGIIAKKASSAYTADLRSKEWLKIKVQRRQEMVIGGFTRNESTSKPFSALTLGVYKNGKLTYMGKVGTGWSNKLQKEMLEQFKPLITDVCPFEVEPNVNEPSRFRPKSLGAKPTWLKPELVCEINYAELTGDGKVRQASFKGLRADKDADSVVLETPNDTDATIKSADELSEESTHPQVNPPKKARRTLLNPKDESQEREVNGHAIKFNHLSKVYWPGDGITKREMFNYYYQVAPYMMPYLKDRPMSLNRFPNGIHGPSFYQKNVADKAPEWARTMPHVTEDGEHKEYLVATEEDSLLWMATLGCIEMNPWFSRVQSADNPDFCVIDLDPDKNTFDEVITAAQHVKKVLDAIGVPAFPKTSGSTGIHVYIPLGAKYSYDQSQLFAKMVVQQVHKQIPDFTSLERVVAKRKGKMYLDFLQNRPGATIAAPYSLRPKPGATVSMPLAWDEVKPGLKMRDFNIKNAIDRLKETGDLFNGVLDKGIDMEKVIKKARSMFS